MVSANDIVQSLVSQISAVCPIDGIAIGKMADKATWRIDFAASATPSQRQAAVSLVTAFDPSSVNALDEVDAIDKLQLKILFNHENRVRVLEGKAQITPAQFKAALRALS